VAARRPCGSPVRPAYKAIDFDSSMGEDGGHKESRGIQARCLLERQL